MAENTLLPQTLKETKPHPKMASKVRTCYSTHLSPPISAYYALHYHDHSSRNVRSWGNVNANRFPIQIASKPTKNQSTSASADGLKKKKKPTGSQQRKSKAQRAKSGILDPYNKRLQQRARWIATYKDCIGQAAAKAVKQTHDRAAAK